MDAAAVERAKENGRKSRKLREPHILILKEVKEYLTKRNYIDNNEVECVIVLDNNKNWQIIQSRDTGNLYIVVLKK